MLPSGDRDNELVDDIAGDVSHLCSVEFEEDRGRKPTQPLVPVNERMVLDDRLEQRCCLRPDVWIGVATEGGGLGPSCCRAQQTDVS